MWRKNEFLFIWSGIIALIILLIPEKASSSGVLGLLRLIFGCLFIAFAPGYTLLAALLPKSTQISFLERIAISFALSIAMLSIMALILDRLPWGITLWPIVIFLCSFTLLMTMIALVRRRRIPEAERYLISSFNLRQWWQNQPAFNRTVFGLLVGATLLGGIAFSIVYSVNHSGDPTTEFYMLNPDGIADYYPSTTSANLAVKLGIGNDEHKNQTYRIDVLVDGQLLLKTDPIQIENGQRWEDDLAIPVPIAGDSHTIEYQLFRSSDASPYRILRLEIHAP